MNSHSIAQYLDGLLAKSAVAYQGLWIFPVCLVSGAFERTEEAVMALSEGLKHGSALVGETGRMDCVRVRNKGAERLVALEGETLQGGAQNRMINVSAAIGPGREAELASCCVEIHRWDIKSSRKIPEDKREFTGCGMAYGALRRLTKEQAAHSLRADRAVRVEQKDVWQNIVQQFGVSGASTKTLDLHDLYEFWEAALHVFEMRFYIQKNQVGMITFLDKKTWFMDIFMNHDMLYKYFKPLVRGYAFDALIRLEAGRQPPEGRARPAIDDAQQKLKSPRTAICHPFPAAGAGNAVFFSTRGGFGTALHDGEHLIHLAACSI